MSGINEIRSTFLDYFKKNDHEIVPSSPLVPRNDPTLMFVNSGMVQFKNVFTGVETRDYQRASTAQKCVRAGGKHNDLDNVGYTARHHTFFEMLGNFSFGDYFKGHAIELAWNLITKEYDLPKDRLLTTVFSEDDEAFNLWKKIAGLPESRIIRIPTSDNFWSMGDTGPCGPCSEIFFDHGDHIFGGPPGSPDEDGDRFVEIWNLVFMQFEQITADLRENLPKPSIDTGMGLERMTSLLAGSHDVYQTDQIKKIIKATEEALGREVDQENSPSYRVIADHLRSTSFLIADGVLPSNEGRGYVLRRIMRRAMRHARLLGASEPLMYKLLPVLVGEMGQAYPELVRAQALISETLKLEETRFLRTLDKGLKILDEETLDLQQGDTLSGEVAFKLYDTYGFPYDLTEDALRNRKIDIDKDGFDAAMERQKAEARKNWGGSGDQSTDRIWFALSEKLGATEFLGYETESAEGIVTAIVKDGAEAQSLSKGDEGFIILNQTPFYGESGGQVGDQGLMNAEGVSISIIDTQKRADGVFAHIAKVTDGEIKVGDALELKVDHARRSNLRMHHSATHLLHEALREVLGDHVAQKGSLVQPGRLRFDFSHPKAIEDNDLQKIENNANQIVIQNDEVSTRLMSVDEAIEAGATALFGEKYGEEVRVVSMGKKPNSENQIYSMELCGGTHVSRTGDIGLIKVVNESAVAAGVRRVEALAGDAARQYLVEQDNRINHLADLLKTTPNELSDRVQQLVEERRKLERELADAKRKLALAGNGSEDKSETVEDLNGVKFIGRILQGIPPKDLRGIADDAKQSLGSGCVAIIGVSDDGKAAIVTGVTNDLTDKLSAVDLVKAGAAALGGKGGGGRPDMAQAGGPNPGQANAALDAIRSVVRS